MANPITVAVVVDPEYGDRLLTLQSRMGVWVVDTPTNRAAWESGHSKSPNGALFSVDDQEARADNLLGVLNDVEEHFGPSSTREPYTELLVLGLPLSDALIGALKEEHFASFRAADDGFVATIARD